MQIMEVNGKKITLDLEGFLENFEDWNTEIALMLAKEQGIEELTEEHWRVINYMQEHYKRFEIGPMIKMICKDLELGLENFYELFPNGPGKGAGKIAGLPKPSGCV